MFAVIPSGEDRRTIFRTSRAQRGEEFAAFEPVEFPDGRPPYFVSPDGLRAYFGSPEGLYLAVRVTVHKTFRNPVLFVRASACGPIEGPVWLTPAEDVVFYCSPGPGQAPGSARRMWMMQF